MADTGDQQLADPVVDTCPGHVASVDTAGGHVDSVETCVDTGLTYTQVAPVSPAR